MRKKSLKKDSKVTLVLFACILFVVCFAFGISEIYSRRLEVVMLSQTFDDMIVTVGQRVESINSVLDGYFTTMESVAGVISGGTLSDSQSEFLVDSVYSESASIAGVDGIAAKNDSGETVDISDRPYFRSSLSGKRVVASIESSRFDSQKCIVASVPVKSGGKVTGVFVVGNSPENFFSLLTSGQVFSYSNIYIVDTSGNVIMQSEKNTVKIHGNFIGYYFPNGNAVGSDAENLTAAFASCKRQSVIAEDRGQDDDDYILSTPLGFSDWSIVTVKHESAVLLGVNEFSRSSEFAITVFLVFFAMILSACVVLIFILRRSRQVVREEMEKGMERLQKVLEERDEASFEWNVEQERILYSDESAFRRIIGVSLPDKLNLSDSKLIEKHPEIDFSRIYDALQSVIITGEAADFETAFRTNSLEKLLLHITMFPLRDRKGRVADVFGTVRNVTAQRENQRTAFFDKDAMIAAVVESYPLFILVNVSRGTYRIMSDLSYPGIVLPMEGTVEELFEGGEKYITEEYRQKLYDGFNNKALLKQFLAGNDSADIEFSYSIGSQFHWCHMQAKYINNPFDEDFYALEMFEKTDEKVAYREMIKKQLKTTLENMDGFTANLMLTEDDIILSDADDGFYSFFGVDRTYLNKSVLYNTSARQREAMAARFRDAAVQREDGFTIECEACEHSGIVHLIRIVASYYGMQGMYPVYYCIIADISEEAAGSRELMETARILRSTAEQLQQAKEDLKAMQAEYKIICSQSEGIVARFEIKTKTLTVVDESITKKYPDLLSVVENFPESLIAGGFFPDDSVYTVQRLAMDIELGVPSGEYNFDFSDRNGSIENVTLKYSLVYGNDGDSVSAIITII